jgi:hypothetical protein
MSDGGKGSKPRPFSVSQEEYDKRWDAIFQRDLPKKKSDYQDILSTEDCVDNTLEEYKKQAQELWNDSCTSHRSKK